MGQTTFCNSTWPWRALFLNPSWLIPCSSHLPAQGIAIADPNACVFPLPHCACHIFQICPAFEKLSSLFTNVAVNLWKSFAGHLGALHPACPFWSPPLALFCLVRALQPLSLLACTCSFSSFSSSVMASNAFYAFSWFGCFILHQACVKINILLAKVSAFKMSVAEEEAAELRRGICANNTVYTIYSSC